MSSSTRSSGTRSSGTRSSGTFVLLLDLLVPRALPQVGQDLGQLGDHDVVGGECGLSLERERERERHDQCFTHVECIKK